MSQRGIGSHTKPNAGLKDEWLTPPEIIEALGPFDLDPCAAVDQPWKTAHIQYTIEEDGLSRPWMGMVWCNPPYGPQTWKWLSALAAHGNGIALIFARTETAGFFDEVWEKADALLFLEGRLHFHHADGSRAAGNSGGPSVLVAYGDEAVERLYGCELGGMFIPLNDQEAAA
jgi:hypothetical protein